MIDFAKLEADAKQLAASGQKDEAIKAAYELAVASAREKDFPRAERWKQELYDLDPMALTEIISAGEIIEEEKAGSLDQNYLDIWAELFQTLSNEETNALYYSLREKVFAPNDTVSEQGSRHSKLYFIVSGQLKVIHNKGNSELFLQTMGQGDIAGVDNFFTISTRTTSLVALSQVKALCLERETMEGWQEDFPGLESKLLDFCQKFNTIPELLKRKGVDRRTQDRFPIEGIVMVELLNASGKSLGQEFKGKLADISGGGASFFIKTSNRKTVRMLLGRRITLSVGARVPGLVESEKVSQTGRITSVIYHLFKDYSVHVKFDTPLPHDVVLKLAALLRADQ